MSGPTTFILLLHLLGSVWPVVSPSPQSDPSYNTMPQPVSPYTNPQLPGTESAMGTQSAFPQGSNVDSQTPPLLGQTTGGLEKTGFPATNTGFPTGSSVTNAGYQNTDTESGAPNTDFGTPNTGFGTPGTVSGSTNNGFPTQINGLDSNGVDSSSQPPKSYALDSFYNNPLVAEAMANILQSNTSSSNMTNSTKEIITQSSNPIVSPENPDDQNPLPPASCEDSMYLEDFCADITTTTRFYFDDSISLQKIIADVFDPLVVEQLSSCNNGSWCLPYSYHKDIKDHGDEFNEIYCKNVSLWSMRGCLSQMLNSRPDCNNRVADFVSKSIGMLCDMWDAPFMELECYARTKKSLYVMFGQLEKERPKDLDMSSCNNYLVQTLQTYMCADDSCHFDQQEILHDFGPWKDLAIDSTFYMYQCNITRAACQGDEYPGDYYYDYDDYYSDDDNDYYQYDYNNDQSVMDGILEKIMNTVQGKTNESSGDGSLGNKSSFDTGDKAIFLGLVGAVIVLSASFLLLLALGFKRFRRGSPTGLPVYTKLATDEDISRAEFS